MTSPENPDFPRGVEVAVAAIIYKDDKLLLIRSPKWESKLAFAGGHVDPGETIFQAAEREAAEETGITVTAKSVVGWGESLNPKSYHRNIHLIYFEVACEYVGGDIKLQADEATAAEWLTVDEALKGGIIEIDTESLQRFKQWHKEQA